MAIDLSIIIVNWKSADYLRNCLQSLYENTSGIYFEVIVVDNASFDGCGEMLETDFPDVRFIQSDVNLGFAGANNLGFTSSSADHLLFLNPDTKICGSAVADMLSVLRTIPDAGAVGCKLLNPDFSIQTSCVQPFPTVLNQFLDVDFLIRKFRRVSLFGVRPLYYYCGVPEPVQVISGACLMTKRHVFEAVNQFSTDYFMYAEDLDLCFKIRRNGYRCYYMGEANVIHLGGASAGKIDHFNTVVKRQSIATFLAKHSGRLTAYSYRLATLCTSIIRLSIAVVVLALGPSSKKRSVSIVVAKWTKVLRWSIGLEGWSANLRNAVLPASHGRRPA